MNIEKVLVPSQHPYTVITYFSKSSIDFIVLVPANIFEFSQAIDDLISKEACIVYDKNDQVISWGDAEFEIDDKNHTKIDLSLDNLVLIYEQIKKNKDCSFFLLALSDYIQRVIDELKTDFTDQFDDGNRNVYRYICIVPSEWKKDIRELLIRPSFVSANLISESDHHDRLLFVSDLESIIYSLQVPFKRPCLKRGQNTILCQLIPTNDSTILVKLDLILTMNNIFDTSRLVLFPKVMKSCQVAITSDEIQNRIQVFLKTKLFLFNQDDVIRAIAEDVYNKEFSIENTSGLITPWITEKEGWKLSEAQIQTLQSIRPSEILNELCKFLLKDLKTMISSNLAKKYKFLKIEDKYSSFVSFNSSLTRWVNSIVECCRRSLDAITIMATDDTRFDINNIFQGAFLYILEHCQNANVYCDPQILSIKDSNFSPSIFLNSRPDYIMKINISFKSTLLSFFVLNTNGIIEEIVDHGHFIQDNFLPCLEEFYDISMETTLYVKELFMQFTEEYLTDSNYLSSKKNIIPEIKAILLNKDLFSSEYSVIATRQKKYIDAFLLMYMIYIKELISTNINYNKKEVNIGYEVSIEKNALDKIIGTKENFRDVIYASNLIKKDDNCKKLRIITHGENYLPLIQSYFKLQFSLKSYFILAQLHEDYIQLTLNQVVTDLEEEQESIIIKDKIIKIPNIYSSFCLNMWNNIMENSSLIDPCNLHKKNMLKLFSLKTKMDFSKNFKQYILENILGKNLNVRYTDIQKLCLNNSCNCKLSFTVNDVLNVSLMPVIQDISSSISSSLKNSEMFKQFSYIPYIFSLIYLNNNPHIQALLSKMLKEAMEDSNQEKEVEIIFFSVQELPNRFLQPTVAQKPLSYQAFQKGALHQVYSKNYGFGIYLDDLESIEEENVDEHKKEIEDVARYKNKRTDIDTIQLEETLFLMVKRGDIINHDIPLRKQFYLNILQPFKKKLKLAFVKAENCDELGHTYVFVDCSNVPIKGVGSREIYVKPNELQVGNDIPVIVSIVLNNHSYTLNISTRRSGTTEYIKDSLVVGEPLTLSRF